MSTTTIALAAVAAIAGAQQCTQPAQVGSNLTIYPCGDPARFAWNYANKGSPYGPRLFQLRSNPTICIAVAGTYDSGNGPLVNVGTATCDQSSYYQGWYIQADGSIVSSLDGSVMDVYDKGTAPGTRIDTFSPNGQSNQIFAYNATTGFLTVPQLAPGFCAGLC